jgi:hypothetical protein
MQAETRNVYNIHIYYPPLLFTLFVNTLYFGGIKLIALSVMAVILKLGFTPGFADIILPSQTIIFL